MSWTYSQSPWSRRGTGAMISIAIHVAVVVAVLAARVPESSPPAPMNASVISAEPQSQTQSLESQTQPLEAPRKPRLSSPTLYVPQPELVLVDAGPSTTTAPMAVASSVPAHAEAVVVSVHVQPVFDADYLKNPAPTYPPLARRMREQGVVYVRVLVSPDGTPDQVELKCSSGSVRLDEAALVTVRKWRFVPARRGSQTVAAWVVVPIAFSLTA